MWKLISNKRKRDIIGWLGAGAAAIAGGAWAVYIYFVPVDHGKPSNCTILASGSVAPCGSINNIDSINVGTLPSPKQ
jgi:hypothetical protein